MARRGPILAAALASLAGCDRAVSPEEAAAQAPVTMRAGHYEVVLEGSDFENGGDDVHRREACLSGDAEYFPRRLAKLGFLHEEMPEECALPSTTRAGNRLTGRQLCVQGTGTKRKAVTLSLDAVIGTETLDGVFRVTNQSDPSALTESERTGMKGMEAARPTITARRTGDC